MRYTDFVLVATETTEVSVYRENFAAFREKLRAFFLGGGRSFNAFFKRAFHGHLSYSIPITLEEGFFLTLPTQLPKNY